MAPQQMAGYNEDIGRFRILVIGNANAGKTTILEKVCKTNGRKPEIKGRKVHYGPSYIAVPQPTRQTIFSRMIQI